MSDDELRRRQREQALAVLKCVSGRRREMNETEQALIKNGRDCGLTWKQIAEALGLGSAQAAQQRYERLGALLTVSADREEAAREAQEEFDRRVVESINRVFVKADSAGYVFARLER